MTQLRDIGLSELFRYEDERFTGRASGDLANVISQLYNYMVADKLQYGILATYDYHWFFCRPSDNPSILLISESLPSQSTNPKTYAYLVRLATTNPKSPHPNSGIFGGVRWGEAASEGRRKGGRQTRIMRYI